MPKQSILKKNSITIREYKASDQDAIIELLNSPSIKASIWEWQFDSACFETCIKPIIAIDKWQNIVGFNGMMPTRIQLRNHGEMEAAWSCDFFVSPETRGLGVGKAIKKELKKQSPITFALGTSETAAAVLQKSGWRPFRQVYTFTLASPSKAHNNTPINNATSSKYKINTQHDLPPDTHIEPLWHRVKLSYNAIICRDYSYLAWRYKDSPVAKYQFITCYQDMTLIGLAVIFVGTHSVTLVDYLGDSKSIQDKNEISRELLRHNKTVKCSTSSTSWSHVLKHSGFSRSHEPMNCFVYSESDKLGQHITDDFFIMPGDCDGDILLSSVNQALIKDQKSASNYRIEAVNAQQLTQLKQKWNSLLSKADNNTLFLTWEWINAWWMTFAKPNNFEINILLCWHKEALVGIAPLYFRRYTRYGLSVKQVQLIGCSWSGPNTFRSEYLDFIIHRQHQRDARVALLDHVFNKQQFSELVLGDIPCESLTTRLIQEKYNGKHCYIRQGHKDFSVKVPTDLTEQDYLKNLSSNFRRNAFNKGRALQESTPLTTRHYSNSNDFSFNLLEQLNRLHLPRWGRPCFEGYARHFHEQLISTFNASNALLISTHEDDQKPVSLTYSLVHNRTVYNIQLGFDTEKYPGYSLGLIELGSSILHCIRKDDIDQFDLLAGYGKREYYKSRFGGKHCHMETKQYLRAKWLIILYKLHDKRKQIKHRLNPLRLMGK